MRATLLILLALLSPTPGHSIIIATNPHNMDVLGPYVMCVSMVLTIILAPIGGICILGEEGENSTSPEILMDQGYSADEASQIHRELTQLAQKGEKLGNKLTLRPQDAREVLQAQTGVSDLTADYIVELIQ